MMYELTVAQRSALTYVESSAETRSPRGGSLHVDVSADTQVGGNYESAVHRIRREARVALAFHPERVGVSGKTVAQALLEDSLYRNQYETGLSSGSVSAFSGGRRDEWERDLFGGAYHRANCSLAERPKYGALILVDHPDGPCPRFGSCYLVLKREVTDRCSFTALGSQEEDAAEHTGTLCAFDPVLRRLAVHFAELGSPLGIDGLTFNRFLSEVAAGLPIKRGMSSPDAAGRALDSFVEAQVHGSVDLRKDAEAMVVDASFWGTEVARVLAELCTRYGCELRWHPGFTLRVDEFPEAFRGFPVRGVATRVAKSGVVDAPSLGEGQNDFLSNPEAWTDLGSASDLIVSFRRVWHFLVLEGRPSPSWAAVQNVGRAQRKA